MLNSDQAPEFLGRFLAILGPEIWVKRYRALEEQTKSNVLLVPFFEERHSLVLTLGRLVEAAKRLGVVPIDTSDPQVYALMSFVAPVVMLHKQLNATAKARIAGMLRDGLNTDRGLLPFKSEIDTATHLTQKGFDLEFPDLEGKAGFDFLARREDMEVEVECKTVSGDVGRKIHRRHMLELSFRLESTVSRVLRRRTDLLVAVVRLPSRLYGHVPKLIELVDVVSGALRMGEDFVGPDPCTVELQAIPIPDTPFGLAAVSEPALRQFLVQRLGKPNPHALFAFTPERSAVAIVVESRQPDKVVAGLMRELRDSAKTQFTATRPGVLVVQFLDLQPAGLVEVATRQSANRSKAPMLQVATNDFFDSPGRSHIHSIVYRSLPDRLHESRWTEGGLLHRTIQERGPMYVFKNPRHPLVADDRFSLLGTM